MACVWPSKKLKSEALPHSAARVLSEFYNCAGTLNFWLKKDQLFEM